MPSVSEQVLREYKVTLNVLVTNSSHLTDVDIMLSGTLEALISAGEGLSDDAVKIVAFDILDVACVGA